MRGTAATEDWKVSAGPTQGHRRGLDRRLEVGEATLPTLAELPPREEWRDLPSIMLIVYIPHTRNGTREVRQTAQLAPARESGQVADLGRQAGPSPSTSGYSVSLATWRGSVEPSSRYAFFLVGVLGRVA